MQQLASNTDHGHPRRSEAFLNTVVDPPIEIDSTPKLRQDVDHLRQEVSFLEKQ